MDRKDAIERYKAQLRHDVAYLCRRRDLQWSRPIAETLRAFRVTDANAVLFGGTLRSLLLSRIQRRAFGRPRDLDIVVAGPSIDDLRKRFKAILMRETRFGGLQLKNREWQFDVWPLHRTWAFVQDRDQEPKFAELPRTTFFNLEAIAVELWPQPGMPRRVYSADDQFFDGIISQTLEINREDNPFPALCIVRSIVMASSTGFSIGPRLARYLVENAKTVSRLELEEAQRQHYGNTLCDIKTIRHWLDHISTRRSTNSRRPIKPPRFTDARSTRRATAAPQC